MKDKIGNISVLVPDMWKFMDQIGDISVLVPDMWKFMDQIGNFCISTWNVKASLSKNSNI